MYISSQCPIKKDNHLDGPPNTEAESNMPAPAHVQAATLQRFLDAWKKWDAEEWLAVFADDFTQVTLPFGLGIPPRPRAQVEQVLPALVATVKSYEVRETATLV